MTVPYLKYVTSRVSPLHCLLADDKILFAFKQLDTEQDVYSVIFLLHGDTCSNSSWFSIIKKWHQPMSSPSLIRFYCF